MIDENNLELRESVVFKPVFRICYLKGAKNFTFTKLLLIRQFLQYKYDTPNIKSGKI